MISGGRVLFLGSTLPWSHDVDTMQNVSDESVAPPSRSGEQRITYTIIGASLVRRNLREPPITHRGNRHINLHSLLILANKLGVASII